MGSRYSQWHKLPLLLVLMVVLLVAIGIWYIRTEKVVAPTMTAQNKPSQKAGLPNVTLPKLTRLIATGDFIGHEALNNAAKQNDGSYDYSTFMDQMKPVMQKAQIRFCNQSTLIGGEKFGVTGYPSFNAPAEFAANMADLGCNVINTASNHSSDKAQATIDANVSIWAPFKNILAVAGQNATQVQHDAVHYFETGDGLKYAFLAYTTYSNAPPANPYGVNMYSREFASRQINEAKVNGAKFIIVSMRWGTEYSPNINSAQTIESQYLADKGVQLVLGHGTHVLEPVKRLKGSAGNDTLVWYSLGNFLHAQEEAETLFNGVAVIDIDPETAAITSVGFLPTYMHYDWTAAQAASHNLLARHNFELVPVEKASALFAVSQLKTTLVAQQSRITSALNTFTEVKILSLKDFGL